MWNDEVTLLTKIIDKRQGQQIEKEPIKKKVLCKKKSVGRTEHYSAAQLGLELDIVIVVKNYEYDGQKELIYNGKKYDVQRTFSTSFEELELMCRLLSKNE